MKSKITCCYFPTTVLFLDDHIGFLQELTKALDSNLVYRLFAYPQDALHFLSQERDFNSRRHDYLFDSCRRISNDFDERHARVLMDVNIAKIHEDIYSSNKFREISVVVVDYDMPGTNGLEFCRKVKRLDDNFIKIIMLTGEADDQLAVQGFNEGIINRFIKKSSPFLTTELNSAISALQHRYFCDLSRGMIESLSINKNCPLDDPAFVELFEELVWKGNFVEYYLIDEFGSFLLLDILGHPSWLIIKSDSVIDQYCKIAEDNYAPEEIKNVLVKREKIPFFFTQKDLEAQVSKWGDYLHPAQKLVGKKNDYYFSLISDSGIYDLQRNRIASYKKYLDALGS
jgi:CheY-like chemotaxis protein